MAFTCIYCTQLFPSRATKSDIIPRSLGGHETLKNAVCSRCNNSCREFEDFFKSNWAWLIFILAVKGRRTSSPPVKATFNFFGKEVPVTIRARNRPPEIPPSFFTDAEGKQTVQLVGDLELVGKKMEELKNRRGFKVWTQLDPQAFKKAEFKFPIKVDTLDNVYSSRLAAKIAFEYWGKRRGPETLLDASYDQIRKFILPQNTAPVPAAGLICDAKLISQNLDIPFGSHAVSVVADINSGKLGAIVALFGVFYYWIILDNRYPVYANSSWLWISSAWQKLSYEPPLYGLGTARIPWHRIIVNDPNRAEKAWILAKQKIEQSLRNAKRQSRQNHQVK